RHTRSYGDWSSDVCSSDLSGGSVASPSTRPAMPPGSHSGSRAPTMGIVVKLSGAGGDDANHSSVPAFHGFAPTRAPRKKLQTRLDRKSVVATSTTISPTDDAKLSGPHP